MVSEVGFVASCRVLQVFLRRFFLPRESLTQRRTNLTEIPADDSSSQAATQPSPPTQILYVGSNLPSPSKLELKGNAASNWKRFRQMWDNYEIASRLILRDPGAVNLVRINGGKSFQRTGERAPGMLLLSNLFHKSLACLSLIGHKKRLTNESKQIHIETLLTCIDKEALEIYDGLAFENGE